jgi:hypothetical protein
MLSILDGTAAAAKGLYTPTTITTVVNPADVPVAIGGTPELPAVVSVELSDGSTKEVAVTWEAVDTSVAATIPVEGDLAGYTEKATVNVIVSPEVVTATASQSNYKEIVVTYTKAVDATEGKATGNYTVKLGDTATTVTAVSLSEDKMTATLTLQDPMTQQKKVTVTVNKKVGLTENTDAVIASALDTTVPVAESITVTGPKEFTVTFSEPVTGGSVEINNGAIGATGVLNATGRKLTVTAGTNLTDGDTYDVKVSGQKDYVPFTIAAKTFADTPFAKDATAPTVELASAKEKEVKVKFNKTVGINGTDTKLSVDYFYQTYTGWNPDTVTSTDMKTYTLGFNDNPLPPGDVIVTVKSTNGDDKVKDAWGNAMAADAKLATSITTDSTPPTMDSVTYKKQTKTPAETILNVTFSEKIQDIEGADFTIKDSDGDKVNLTVGAPTVVADTGELTYKVTLGKVLAAGDYTITIKKGGVQDKGNVNDNDIAETTLGFTVTDKLAPEVTPAAVYIDNATGKDYVYAKFSEKMDQSTDGAGVLNKANWRVDGKALADKDKVEAFGTDGKTVKLTIDGGFVFTNQVLQVGQVEDASGNPIVAFATTVTLEADAAPVVTSINMTAKNKVEIKLDKVITSSKAEGITVTDGTYSEALASIDEVVVKDGATTIKATLKAKVVLADAQESKDLATSNYAIKIAADKIKSETGKAATAGVVGVAFTDKVKPSKTGDLILTRASATNGNNSDES